ncbi:hypothetical protein [Crinalium epipsammum]|nr:hypothetical protein [Crinalium epipsammum]
MAMSSTGYAYAIVMSSRTHGHSSCRTLKVRSDRTLLSTATFVSYRSL